MKNDLEKIRDEKCFPLAQTLLEVLSDEAFDEDGIKKTVLKTLSLMLGKDLNIDTDVSYIPQLILGSLSGMNTTVQTCDMVPLEETRYNTIAVKMLKILTNEKVKMGINPDQVEDNFKSVKEQLDTLFMDEKLNSLEVKYIMDKIFNMFTSFNNTLSASIESSVARAEAKLFGFDSMSDLTMQKLDEILKS